MKEKCCHCGHGVQKFSDYTTMHGFRELYYAKSIFWKIIWLIIIVAAIALSVYQLYNSIASALNQSTSTVIQPLEADPDYPPLRICYLHWIYWLNWNLAMNMGFSRPSVLYAMSFLSDIVSDQTFNFTEAKTDFEITMKKNHLTTLTQFYSAVSNSTPPGITVTYLEWTNWTKALDPAYEGRLCYTASKEMVKHGLETERTDTITLSCTYDSTGVDLNYIHPQEMILYMETYILSLLKHPLPLNVTIDYIGFKAAPVLNVDHVKVSLVMPSKETFQSIIKITGTVYKWLNTYKRPCSAGKATTAYDFCDKICYWQEMQRVNSGSCMNIEGAILFNNDTNTNLCRNRIIFLDTGQMIQGNYSETLIPFQSQSYNTCLAEYCMVPCEHWQYASTVSSLPVPTEFAFLNFPTIIYIEYPTKAAILVISEVVSQTWETMIGNLGGIFGLWLGASILSIVQMFYLLCCEQCDQKMADGCCKRKKLEDTNQAMTTHLKATRPKTIVLSSSLLSANPYPYC